MYSSAALDPNESTLEFSRRDLGEYRLDMCCLHQSSYYLLNSGSRFNIANLTTSYLLNSEQLLAVILAPLKYASLHWAHHLHAADVLRTSEVLFWLGVLNASGIGGRASSLIAT
jgi:hypothetical protein